MTDFLHVVGARPNLPKLAPVYRALKARGADQVILHTGQHSHPALARTMREELGLPPEDINLQIGLGTPTQQISRVMVRLEPTLEQMRPRMVVVYGDVSSTLAAALVASRCHHTLAHVESGLRSGDRSMPEELNRLVTDQLCDLALATSPDAVENLLREGRDPGSIHLVGNPMIDSLRDVEHRLPPSVHAQRLGAGSYALVTLHRPGNVDDAKVRSRIVEALLACADLIPLVFPVHPRRRGELQSSGLGRHPSIVLTDPLGYTAFLSELNSSRAIITDSGGVQEESTALDIPCLTLRPNTERPITLTHGTNRLVSPSNLVSTLRVVLDEPARKAMPLPPYWDGRAGERIADVLLAYPTSSA